MPRYSASLQIVALTLLAAGLLACSPGVAWSSRERENAAHILASLQATSAAASIANRTTGADPAEREKLLQALRAAHLHAVRVEDSVLDKLHQRMYGKFRLDYQRALAKMIRAYENGDPDAAREAALDIREFMDWYRHEKHTFRWWRGGPADGEVN